MKKKVTLLILLATACISFAQTPLPIEISYDAAGNRITRKVLQISTMSKGGNYADSTYYLDQMQSIQMKVYPNPTQGKVYITMSEIEENAFKEIRLYDNQGKLVYKSDGYGNTIEIDISSYPTGYYMVELYVNEEHTTWKIIKQ